MSRQETSVDLVSFECARTETGRSAAPPAEVFISPTKAVYLLIVPGYADWEPAHAVAELRRHGHYRVEVVGIGSDPVESMGGLRVIPSKTLSEMDPAEAAILVLPGGDFWEQMPLDPALEAGVRRLDAAGVPLAAICAATTAVARWGLLRDRFHTSNGLTYLQEQVPAYAAAARYLRRPAVRDTGLITASGLGDVEFAREIMAELGVLSDSDRDVWQRMFRSGQLPDDAA